LLPHCDAVRIADVVNGSPLSTEKVLSHAPVHHLKLSTTLPDEPSVTMVKICRDPSPHHAFCNIECRRKELIAPLPARYSRTTFSLSFTSNFLTEPPRSCPTLGGQFSSRGQSIPGAVQSASKSKKKLQYDRSVDIRIADFYLRTRITVETLAYSGSAYGKSVHTTSQLMGFHDRLALQNLSTLPVVSIIFGFESPYVVSD
jgi:hypothetical protein